MHCNGDAVYVHYELFCRVRSPFSLSLLCCYRLTSFSFCSDESQFGFSHNYFILMKLIQIGTTMAKGSTFTTSKATATKVRRTTEASVADASRWSGRRNGGTTMGKANTGTRMKGIAGGSCTRLE